MKLGIQFAALRAFMCGVLMSFLLFFCYLRSKSYWLPDLERDSYFIGIIIFIISIVIFEIYLIYNLFREIRKENLKKFILLPDKAIPTKAKIINNYSGIAALGQITSIAIIKYEYKDKKGIIYKGYEHFEDKKVQNLRKGDIIDIYYDLENPSCSIFNIVNKCQILTSA